MTIDRLLAIPDGRQRALEIMLVAHLMLDRRCLGGRTRPRLTPACEALVDLMFVEPVNPGLLTGVLISLRLCRHGHRCYRDDPVLGPEPRYYHLLQCTGRARYTDIVRIAQAAQRLTVDELSYLQRETVLELLGSRPLQKGRKTSTDRLLDLAEATAA